MSAINETSPHRAPSESRGDALFHCSAVRGQPGLVHLHVTAAVSEPRLIRAVGESLCGAPGRYARPANDSERRCRRCIKMGERYGVLWPAYEVDTRLRHHGGSEWIVREVRGGLHDDHLIECVVGTERPGLTGGERVGATIVVHGEYIPRSFRIVHTDPHAICVAALREHWAGEAYASDVVGWMFEALDREGNTTVPRDAKARAEAEVMCNMVFADIGEECDYSAVVSNVLRAAESSRVLVAAALGGSDR